MINKLAIFISRQLREVVGTRGKVLRPKFAPYVKYLKYMGKDIPFKQISALDNLLIFTRFLYENGISYFLSGGTLLGAVRQSSFAGRPGDIDLGILEDDQIKLLKLLPQLEKLNIVLEPMYSHYEFDGLSSTERRVRIFQYVLQSRQRIGEKVHLFDRSYRIKSGKYFRLHVPSTQKC